jgi:hypothetical protein
MLVARTARQGDHVGRRLAAFLVYLAAAEDSGEFDELVVVRLSVTSPSVGRIKPGAPAPRRRRGTRVARMRGMPPKAAREKRPRGVGRMR